VRKAGRGRLFTGFLPRHPLSAAAELLLLAALASLIYLPLRLAGLALYAAIFAIDYRFYELARRPLDGAVVRLAWKERENARIVISSQFGSRGWIAFGISLVCAELCAAFPARPLLAIGLLLLLLARPNALPPLLTFLRAAAVAVVRRGDHAQYAMRRPQRTPLETKPGEPSGNILLIVCESLNRGLLTSPAGKEATPRYHRFLAAHRLRLTEFPRALANSSCSDLSYPSLFTGLSPAASSNELHQHPLIWSVAKACGYSTSLYSSQSLSWQRFDEFFIDHNLDRSVWRESLQAPAANDIAMDDRLLNPLIIRELTESGRPFFSVVNYNMLHFPFLCDQPNTRDYTSRYLAALAIFDQCFGALTDALEASGHLENTAIFFTGDHGEDPDAYDFLRPAATRLDDLTPALLSIPFWSVLPANSEHLTGPCAVNAHHIVSNLDLFPTLAHFMRYPGPFPALAGHSLLHPLPPDRAIVSLNSGELRQWPFEPFALTRAGATLFYHDLRRKFELVHWDDPSLRDHWPELPRAARQEWLAHAREHPALDAILSARRLDAIGIPNPDKCEAEYNSRAALGRSADLHQLNNWVLFSKEDWETLCLRTAELLAIHDGDRIFESGCGAGAFLDVLLQQYHLEVSGVDRAGELVKIAQQRIQGKFWAADIQDLSPAPSDSYDKVVSHGVFLYLPTVAAVERAALEMVRVAKPGGVIYIGLLNDPERLAAYRTEHPPSGNYLVTRDFWRGFAERHRLPVRIVNQEDIFSKPQGYDAHARLRYSVFLDKPGSGVNSVGGYGDGTRS